MVIDTSLITFSIYSELLAHPVWKDKISGYNLIRGTAVVRVVLNPQPFQAGRLLLRYVPCFYETSNSRAVNYGSNINRNLNITMKTQQPCVELDVADTSAEIRIPYIAPTLWLNRALYTGESNDNVGFYDWGTFFLDSLAGVRSGVTTSIPYTIYLYFEDFELAAPMATESANVNRSNKKIVAERKNYARDGVISGTLEALREPTQLLKKVPFIGETIVDTADALLGFGAGVLAAFGWSKPIDSKPQSVVKVQPAYRNFNYNGNVCNDVIAMDSQNSLQIVEAPAGTNQDEMSFAYLKKIPALIDNFTWTTSQPNETQIYTRDLEPSSLYRVFSSVINTFTNNRAVGAPFTYLSRFFMYYRGSIDVTIKVVKTTFHSGRIEVVYVPAQSGSTIASKAPYAYRQILDLRESNVVTFNIPWIRGIPYLPIGQAMGKVSINVVNPLVASSTVSSTVDVLVYYNAGTDFELQGLKTIESNMVPEAETPENMGSHPIGGAPMGELTLAPAKSTIGEFFTSVKQLTNSMRTTNFAPNWYTNNPYNGISSTYFNPFLHGLNRYDASMTSANQGIRPAINGDLLSQIAVGYAFERGGIRYYNASYSGTSNETATNLRANAATRKFLGAPTAPSANSGFVTLYNNNVSVNLATNITPNTSPQIWRTMFNNTGVDVTIPHYGPTHLRVVRGATLVADDVYTNIDYPPFSVQQSANTTFPAVARGGSDDYTLHFFLGFPGWII